MDNLCDQGATFIEDEINLVRLHSLSTLAAPKQLKPLRPHEKVQILFDIVKKANSSPILLQDAKDIFDFI